jgi:hypothetical protein
MSGLGKPGTWPWYYWVVIGLIVIAGIAGVIEENETSRLKNEQIKNLQLQNEKLRKSN